MSQRVATSERIVIVGAGFCGTVLAAMLLRHKRVAPLEIVLVERGAEIGRGLAYATHRCDYLLNVPAGRLSADARDPLQFLRFAQRVIPEADGEDFLPRRLYGDYLQDVLATAERESAPHVRLVRLFADAVDVTPGEVTSGDVTSRDAAAADAAAPLTVHFSAHEPIAAGRVVLALGNPPPMTMPWAAALQPHPAYRDNPWSPPENLRPDHAVLIVGNGLTMADVVSALSGDPARTPQLSTLSRRGLMPLPQSTFHAAAVRGDGAGLLAHAGSIREVLAASRGMAREITALGGDWREVITFIRNLVPRLWQRLPDAERRRFVRHLQSYWDVHRHRLPPGLAQHLDALRSAGRLQIHAGRIDAVTAEGDRLRVTWRRRGSTAPHWALFDSVINATGPDYSLARSRDPLLVALRRAGKVSADALNLGLRTGMNGACVGADGSLSRQLFYLGPLLRADHWEATAATELRNHAETLGQHLAGVAAPG